MTTELQRGGNVSISKTGASKVLISFAAHTRLMILLAWGTLGGYALFLVADSFWSYFLVTVIAFGLMGAACRRRRCRGRWVGGRSSRPPRGRFYGHNRLRDTPAGPGQSRQRCRDVKLLDLFENVRHQSVDDFQNVVAFDERHLDVDLSELRLPVGAEVFVPETASQLIVTVEARHHEDLLVNLRRLR